MDPALARYLTATREGDIPPAPPGMYSVVTRGFGFKGWELGGWVGSVGVGVAVMIVSKYQVQRFDSLPFLAGGGMKLAMSSLSERATPVPTHTTTNDPPPPFLPSHPHQTQNQTGTDALPHTTHATTNKQKRLPAPLRLQLLLLLARGPHGHLPLPPRPLLLLPGAVRAGNWWDVGVGRDGVADGWMDCMYRGGGESIRYRVIDPPHPDIASHQPTHQAYEASRRAKQLAVTAIFVGTLVIIVYYFSMRRQARRSGAPA